MNFIELYRHFLELQKGVNFEKPIYYPKMKQKFKNKIEKIAPLEKIVLFCPEAKSIKHNLGLKQQQVSIKKSL